MKKATKAILASAFVFPGMGQLLLKRPISGTIFAALALTATAVIIMQVVTIASDITARIVSGEIAPDILLMRKLVNEQLANSGEHWIQGAIWLLIAVWIVSVLDAYRITRKQNENN